MIIGWCLSITFTSAPPLAIGPSFAGADVGEGMDFPPEMQALTILLQRTPPSSDFPSTRKGRIK